MNQVMNRRVRHIYIMYIFIRQAVFNKTIELVKIDDIKNSTDALTEVISLKNFRQRGATMKVVYKEHS